MTVFTLSRLSFCAITATSRQSQRIFFPLATCKAVEFTCCPVKVAESALPWKAMARKSSYQFLLGGFLALLGDLRIVEGSLQTASYLVEVLRLVLVFVTIVGVVPSQRL